MGLSLTDRDVQDLEAALTLLVSPLAFATADDWRLAVNRSLLPLMRADSAGFLLPGVGGPPMLSEQHDPKDLAAFPELAPPPRADGVPIWACMLERKVATLEALYADDMSRYHASAYYTEYAAPNGAAETVAAAFALPALGPGAAASLHFWHRTRGGRRAFGEREAEILRLLFPAFRAGVDMRLRFGAQGAQLAETIDALDAAALLIDYDEIVLHQTRALESMLAGDADAALLRLAMHRQGMGALRGGRQAVPPSSTVSTATGRYRVQSTRLTHPQDGRTVALVRLERLDRAPRSAETLRTEFGLTARELAVASRIAEGMANGGIAAALGISPHTARRHTERVFKKLGVQTRAGVCGRVLR